MLVNTLTLRDSGYPEMLRHLFKPPEQLFCAGVPLKELLERPRVAIVGSRKITPYGKQVTLELARQLAERGIVIISGLAIGVDALAHRTTLDASGLTIAVLPSPLDNIAPRTNYRLAQEILDKGGTLVSEYSSGTAPQKQFFITRNRIVAGLADALLITEAAEKSGSLHTARFALEQGKDVLAVPGNITVPNSVGTNNLIKAGAVPVTSYKDVLHVLRIKDNEQKSGRALGRNAHEQTILDLLSQGVNNGDQLLEQSALSASQFNQVLTMLEIAGKIRSLGTNQWSLC